MFFGHGIGCHCSSEWSTKRSVCNHVPKEGPGVTKDPTKTLGIRFLLADVDGTLVTQDKILTDRPIAAVRKLGDAGIGFAVTSGRPPKGMSMLIDPLDLRTP